jgi:quinol monooxygenase YgiN
MAIRLIVNMSAAKGKGEEFAKAFNANVPNVRKEPGCEEYALYRSTEEPDRFILVERWTTQQHLDEHGALLRSRPSATANLRGSEPAKVERYEV